QLLADAGPDGVIGIAGELEVRLARRVEIAGDGGPDTGIVVAAEEEQNLGSNVVSGGQDAARRDIGAGCQAFCFLVVHPGLRLGVSKPWATPEAFEADRTRWRDLNRTHELARAQVIHSDDNKRIAEEEAKPGFKRAKRRY